MTLPDGDQIPTSYLREGNQVFAGADGHWWRALRDGDVPATLPIKSEGLKGKARAILDDPAYTNDVFKRLRSNVRKWLPNWLNGDFIVIDFVGLSK